jgi:hypothetical protein
LSFAGVTQVVLFATTMTILFKELMNYCLLTALIAVVALRVDDKEINIFACEGLS